MRLRSGATVALLLSLSLAACGNDDDNNDASFQISVEAEIVETDAPVIVEAGAVDEDEDGMFSHAVTVTWQGDQLVTLDDARFTHSVPGDDEGHLVTSGRGCTPQWIEDSEQIAHVCTDDLQIIIVEPGESHDYPVRVHPEVDSVQLERGTYVVEEMVDRWVTEDENNPRPGDPDGTFTIRLTYEVE